MNHLRKMSLMTMSLLMVFACAEDEDGATAAMAQEMMDSQAPSPNDVGPGETDVSQPPEPSDASGGSGGNEPDAQEPDSGGDVANTCDGFPETHFYRQSAERFADYEIRHMCDFLGETLLIVNSAARCGLTPQYEGLVNLENEYGPQGLRILGFLSNDFGNQAGTTDQVEMCNRDYQVTFEQFTPIGVLESSRDGQHPIFQWLTTQPGMEGDIEWNFGKFLVSGDGVLLARWSSYEQPESAAVTTAIEDALGLEAGSE
ncbi:MAG: glutathione peroxidase [Bradymonadia bacterium]